MDVRGDTCAAPAGSAGLPCTIAEAGEWLRSGRMSCQELTTSYLSRIAELEPRLSAFITLMSEQALGVAAERDADLSAGRDLGPLHGIPIVVKDIFDTRGVRTTVGSRLFENRVPAEDADVVERLKAAGTVLLGKTNMNEFAAGVTGTNEAYGHTHNPWMSGRSPGGSSGGSGAAVAAGLCLGATATDTGGSIRIPASWCGIAGIRPTHGLVSLKGVYARSYSLDVAGPLAPSVADLAILLDAMVSGETPPDRSGSALPHGRYVATLQTAIAGVRLGIVKNYTYSGVDAEVAAAVRSAAETLSELGAEIVEIVVPALEDGADCTRLFNSVLLYEFNQILGNEYRATPHRQEVFGSIVQRNIADGEKICKEDYDEALRRRAALAEDIRQAFESVDALLTPAQPMVAPPLHAPPKVFARGRQFALPFSLAGLPSAVITCGFSSEGLPVGLQIVGDRLEDALILRVASAFEAGTDWHRRRPRIFPGLAVAETAVNQRL